MATLSNSFVISKSPALCLSSDSSSKSVDLCIANAGPNKFFFGLKDVRKSSTLRSTLTVRAGYSDGGRTSSASIFIGGFVLGGLVVGTLGCAYAPQLGSIYGARSGSIETLRVSKALAGTDKKDIMKKLPKFIFDEEKALERQRKKLAEKIEQLNSAIDNVSNRLPSEDSPNGVTISSDDIEAVL